MRRLSLFLLLTLPTALGASGCITIVPNNNNNNNNTVCNLPSQQRSQQQYNLFRVRPGSFAEIPASDFGFSVTANTTGGYRVAYSDQGGQATCFQAILSVGDEGGVVGAFEAGKTIAFGSPKVESSASNEIRIASAPGSDVHGVDVVTTTDPLFLDVFINGTTTTRIFFPDNTAGGALAVVTSTNRGAFDPR
jgi:hypothetical protein